MTSLNNELSGELELIISIVLGSLEFNIYELWAPIWSKSFVELLALLVKMKSQFIQLEQKVHTVHRWLEEWPLVTSTQVQSETEDVHICL